MAKDYLIIKIDSRMKKGRDVIAKLRGDRRGGIPWITILDGKSKELVTSDGPKGNVGCPMRDHEIDWFMKMLGKTSKHMSEADVKTVETSLRAYAKKILGRRR